MLWRLAYRFDWHAAGLEVPYGVAPKLYPRPRLWWRTPSPRSYSGVAEESPVYSQPLAWYMVPTWHALGSA